MAEIKTRARRGRKAAAGEILTDQMVLLQDIVLDADIQPRETISMDLIAEYAEAMEEGAQFPPVVLFRDENMRLVAADGWHRVNAAKKAGLTEIKADIHPGTERDAILYSVSANATHGLRRTDADKRRAVMRLLQDEDWSKWSASVIAQKVGVSQPFVSTLRRQLEGEESGGEVLTADGRTMVTGNIGGRGGRRRQGPTLNGGSGTNGHGTLTPVGGGDALAVLDAEPLTAPVPADPTKVFAVTLMETLLRLQDFEPIEVIRALDSAELNELRVGWDEIIGKIDQYSDAIGAVLVETGMAGQDATADEDEDDDDEDDEDLDGDEDEDEEEDEESDEQVN